MNRRYLLTILAAILVCNYADRLIFGVVLQDIKRDLALTDTQLGVLSGIAFALFYALLGIPIARWADCGNRVTILSVTLALWSIAVACCGAVTSFFQLLVMRICVGVGEAGGYAPALSLIADHFTRAERPRAVSRYMLGVPIAILVGYLGAGWINEFFGWRITFVVFGIPGMALALLTALTLRDPRSRHAGIADPTVLELPGRHPTLGQVLRHLWAQRTYRHLLVFFVIWGFFGNGVAQWQPAFFMRSYGLHSGQLGTWFAIVNGGAGLLGTWIGGELASRYAANDESLQLRGLTVLYAGMAVLSAAVFLAPSYPVAFMVLGFVYFSTTLGNGALFATLQTLVPAQMRGMSIAILYFFSNLIGLGFGPLAIGALSDALRPLLGEESLRFALLAFSPGYLWCAFHLWKASRTAAGDVAVVQARWSPNPGNDISRRNPNG